MKLLLVSMICTRPPLYKTEEVSDRPTPAINPHGSAKTNLLCESAGSDGREGTAEGRVAGDERMKGSRRDEKLRLRNWGERQEG